METKVFEVRDVATFIPVVCVDMNPGSVPTDSMMSEASRAWNARCYLLRRCGYSCSGEPKIAMARMSAYCDPFNNDPSFWDNRTLGVAHGFIQKNWADLKDGDVVDVRFILGETPAPAVSEREKAVG